MTTASSMDGLGAAVFVKQLQQAIWNLPRKDQGRLTLLGERLAHWIHLQNEANRLAYQMVDDLKLENACLRFDLEVTRRERDESRGRAEEPGSDERGEGDLAGD